jgi:hypothetical protein
MTRDSNAIPSVDGAMTEEKESTSLIAQAMLGPIGMPGDYYFPSKLIGGCCPRVVGEEQDIVWNAAAEASDSERVHVVWHARGDKIWYLAVRSSELASHPNTWCPFASLLPGAKDANIPPVCYTYHSDEAATMMTILADSLQIHRGTSSVVRAKAERTARALGGAQIIELVPDRIEKLSPVPWFSLSLFEDRARRILATLATISAIICAGLALVIWLFATMTMVTTRADMAAIQARSEGKSFDLMRSVQNLRASTMREQLAKFADLNDGLLGLNGMLSMYRIKDGRTLWLASLPAYVTSDRIAELGGQTLDSTPQAVVIGNSRDALTLGARK